MTERLIKERKVKRSNVTRILLGSFTLGMLALAGCQSTTPKIEANAQFPESSIPAVNLQPGDMVRVTFPYWPELDEEQQIRPDGIMSLKLVGDVVAVGKNPSELREELLELYADKIKEPEINVVVVNWDERRIYVTGEVLAPGPVPVRPDMTVLQAVASAGGFAKGSAKIRRVGIVRSIDGTQYARTVDLRDSLREATSEAFELMPNDVVYVPRTTIDRVDQWVDQYVNRIIPDSVIFNLTHQLGTQQVETSGSSPATSFQFQTLPTGR